jgi:ElaB/YqjD/DUF883 family membrane-anchored ribosome-binding protein
MEFRTKNEIIQDIERHRKEARKESRRSKATDAMHSLTLGLQATRQVAAKGYSAGLEQMHRFETRLQAHMYGAVSIALSAGAVLGLIAGRRLKSAPAEDSNDHD